MSLNTINDYKRQKMEGQSLFDRIDGISHLLNPGAES
jgi:hypothetical protein